MGGITSSPELEQQQHNNNGGNSNKSAASVLADRFAAASSGRFSPQTMAYRNALAASAGYHNHGHHNTARHNTSGLMSNTGGGAGGASQSAAAAAAASFSAALSRASSAFASAARTRSPGQPLTCPLCGVSLDGADVAAHFYEEVHKMETLRK